MPIMIAKAGHRLLPAALLLLIMPLVVASGQQPTASNGPVLATTSSPPVVPTVYYPYQNFLDKYYQASSSYQPSGPNMGQYETMRRSQEDMQLSPAMHQLASSLLAASANSASNFDTADQQNYTTMDNEFFASPYGNYFMNSQYYPAHYDPSRASAGSFAVSPTALEQYASLLQTNHSAKNNKLNNKQGLGRRIGELVSNSAERASRAFKSFSQFKLFNDIKPSRLLGLVSDQQSPDAKVVNASALSASPSSAWYYPQTGNPWASYMVQSPSFYQQPVYMRTQEMAANGSPAAPVGSLNSLINPSAVSPMSGPPKPDFLSSMPDFFPQKMSLENSPMYNSVVGAQSSGQFPAGSSSTMVPLGPSSTTTTVYHHFPGDSNQNSGTNNQQPQDLFAAPQTQFGVRMKPPKDFEFDGSNEEDMGTSAEQDDAKMADNGNSPNGGRNSMDNNENSSGNDRFNDRPQGGQGGGNGAHWTDEYSDPSGGIDQDLFNAYNPNSGGQRFRPFNTGHSSVNRPSPLRPVPQGRPYVSGIRRPVSLGTDFDEPDSWYNTFFGNNVKPMSPPRLRNVPFSGNAPLNFSPHGHHHHTSSMLNSASTNTPTALSPDSYMSPYGAMRPAEAHSPNYFHFPSAPRPAWPYSLYHPSANAYLSQFRPNPMMATATSVRPVTMPYFSHAPNYFVPRFPRGQSIFGTYPGAFPGGYNAPAAMQNTANLMGATPFAMPRYPAMTPFSMMPAASSMYPMRVPFSPMMVQPMAASMPFGMAASSMMPTFAQPPIMRYRMGADLTPSATRRAINITKRAQVGGTLDLVDQASNVLSKVSQAIANTLPSVKGITRAKATNHADGVVVPNREEHNLATLYNAYQVLQRRMEAEETSSQPPPPYYQYYISRDTTTSTSTAAPSTLATVSDSGEHIDSSARAIPLNFTSTSARAIKARHIKDQLLEHEKRQDEIRKFLTEAPINVTSTSSTVEPSSTTARSVPASILHQQHHYQQIPLRQAKAVSGQPTVATSSDQWRPILRPSFVRQRVH